VRVTLARSADEHLSYRTPRVSDETAVNVSLFARPPLCTLGPNSTVVSTRCSRIRNTSAGVHNMNATLGFLAFVVSLLLYLLVARKAGKVQPTHPNQFFLSQNAHDESQFAASQITYALQMATVYPFFVFAFTGAWWIAAWNTLFYAIGIILLYAVLPRFMSGHCAIVGSSRTIHAFIANLHGAPALRRFTAGMSIVGFTGLTAFELVWGARILRVLFGGNSSIYYLAIVILAFYLVLYLWLGGQRGTINTGQFQLVIAYVGLHAAVAWALLQPKVSVANMDAPVLLPVIVIIGVLMLVSRLRWLRLGLDSSKLERGLAFITISSLIVMLAVICSKSGVLSAASFTSKTIERSTEFWWQLSAFALLPLFFQFVDMTNWQRMASLASSDQVGLLRHVRNGLWRYLLESPLSWLLPVVLGLCAIQMLGDKVEGDSWDAFIARVIESSGLLNSIVATLIIAGVAAIFLSTADGLLSAIGYSYAYDVDKRTRTMLDRETSTEWKAKDVNYVIGRGRAAMATLLLAIILIFLCADIAGDSGEKILGVFLAFFTPMMAFAPAILIPAVTGRVASPRVATLAIVGGALVGVASGIVSAFRGGLWQWASIDATFVVSWATYLLGFWSGPKRSVN
jgi:Na+/proline symporter